LVQCSGDGGECDMSPCLLGEEESRARRASLCPIANACLIDQYLFSRKSLLFNISGSSLTTRQEGIKYFNPLVSILTTRDKVLFFWRLLPLPNGQCEDHCFRLNSGPHFCRTRQDTLHMLLSFLSLPRLSRGFST